MKCSYCDEEIKEDGGFYIYKGEIYCDECCKEETYTYYVFGDDPENHTEDGVKEFGNKKEAINYLERQLHSIKETIKELKSSDKCYAKYYIEMEEKDKVRIEKTLKILKDEQED